MPVISFKEKTPTVSASAFVAPDAWIIGDVSVADDVSVFFNVVLRGDIDRSWLQSARARTRTYKPRHESRDSRRRCYGWASRHRSWMYDRGSVLDRHGSDDTRQRGRRRRFYSWSPYTHNQRNYRSARKPRHGNPRQGNPPAQSRGDKKPPRLGEGVSRFGRLLSNHLASITAWRAGGITRDIKHTKRLYP